MAIARHQGHPRFSSRRSRLRHAGTGPAPRLADSARNQRLFLEPHPMAAHWSRDGLVKPMEMMDRSIAVADVETIGCRDRGTDPGLGIADRGFHVVTPGQTGGDGG